MLRNQGERTMGALHSLCTISAAMGAIDHGMAVLGFVVVGAVSWGVVLRLWMTAGRTT